LCPWRVRVIPKASVIKPAQAACSITAARRRRGIDAVRIARVGHNRPSPVGI
jgi:hypothetical protein